MAGAAAFKSHGADCVIGFGGGAALDVAKVVGLMAVHDGDILEYVWDHPHVRPITQPLPWFVALPTTAGTGSAASARSVTISGRVWPRASRCSATSLRAPAPKAMAVGTEQ